MFEDCLWEKSGQIFGKHMVNEIKSNMSRKNLF